MKHVEVLSAGEGCMRRFHNILLDEVLGGIHRLTINCPKELNALNAGALEMDRAMDILVADPTARECC